MTFADGLMLLFELADKHGVQPLLHQALTGLSHAVPAEELLKLRQAFQANLHKSPMYSGAIEGIGPRYCPSIEDKIVKFAEKERHQIFLEPEGIATDEIYVNGFSTCLPFDVQVELVRTIVGCENAEIMRPLIEGTVG